VTRTLRIGTRGSALALVQANWVAARLAERGITTEIHIIRTEGDDRPVDTAWGEGAFVGRIVAALLDGSVDLAVHSAKDVPTVEPDLLCIAAFPPREDPRDALVARVRGTTLATLPHGARVGTDSPRRAAMLLAARPDLQLHPLHGNVDTRLAKLDRGDSDALVLAVAGLTRLGRADRIDEALSIDTVVSAPGQGSLALQTRADDAEAIAALSLLDHAATRAAVEAERAFLAATGGGCRSAIGALGSVHDDTLQLVAAAGRAIPLVAGSAIAPAPVAWVRGSAPRADRLELGSRLAARVVGLRGTVRVLVGRPTGQASELVTALAANGIEAAHVPAIEISGAVVGGSLDRALQQTRDGDHIVVTSANGAREVLAAAARITLTLTEFRWAAVGDATAAILLDAGLGPVFVPTLPDGPTLGAELPVQPGDRVLVAQADIADGAAAIALAERGARVVDVVAYTTREAPEASRAVLADALDDGPLDALILTSGSIARGLLALAADDAAAARLRTIPVIAAGATTAAVARDLGYTRVLVAPAPGATALAEFTAVCFGLAPDGTHPLSAHPDQDPATTAGVAR